VGEEGRNEAIAILFGCISLHISTNTI
jgi:hypothetical protein